MEIEKEPKWLTLAIREVGQKEIMGIKHNPRIIRYHQATKLGATEDEVPWCSAFINWVFQECGVEGTRSPLARSWLKWGEELADPYKGCIVVFKRGLYAWQGHVGFFIHKHGDKIQCLGGNQNNSVKISYYNESNVLGYREPTQDDLKKIDLFAIPEPLKRSVLQDIDE